MDSYLSPTYFINSDHPGIIEFTRQHTQGSQTRLESAVKLFYAVRDTIRYNPYEIGTDKEQLQASFILASGRGYCVTKAVLLCACARAARIPARLGFADLKNHLSPPKLRAAMGTNVFVYHGYTHLFLEDKWVKATPAFNLEMCESSNIIPVEFDGKQDAVFHSKDQNGNLHTQYIKERGTYHDLPIREIIEESMKWYPKFFEALN